MLSSEGFNKGISWLEQKIVFNGEKLSKEITNAKQELALIEKKLSAVS